MQEITSISKGESLSETVQKKMSGLTGDPLTESLYAIMQGQVNGEGNQLCRFTAAATNEDKVALDQLKEMKSKEHSISRLESLAKKKNDKVVFNSEANPEREPQYLLPEFVVETRAGLNVRAKASSQTVRTNKGFSEGVHYWEIICPISCSTLQIGVSNISNRNQTSEVYHQFRTTTPRVVGLELNLEKLTLNFWLNGRFIKERMKKIPEGDVWYPTIKFKEADYFVILNPFAQGKGQGVEEQNSNYLPNSLRSVESYVYQSFIESTLRGIIVAYGLTYIETKDSYETSIKNQLKINGSDVKNSQLFLLDYETLSKDSLIFAILKFENELDAIKYYHNNTDLKLLYPKQISKLLTLQDEKEKAKLGLPSYLDKFQELSKALVDLLISKVLNQDTIYYFLTYSGLSLKTSAQDLGQYLIQIHESLEQGTLPSYNIYQSHEKHQALSDVKYLEHSDKLLLLNDSQLKLIHRENGILDLESNPHFTMFPKSSTDMIRMNLSRRNLQFLIKNLDWSIINQSHFDIIQKFLQYCSEKSNTTHLLIPYIIAVQAINILLNVAITQYETLEQNFDILQEQEILHNFSKKHNKDLSTKQYSNNIELGFEYGKISVLDVHQLFNILLTLEDELWAKAQDDQIPTAVKDLWVKKGARLHTAYGRLSSLITFPQSVDPQSQFDPISMAEAGLINVDDKYGKLAMYQEFKVEIENVFQFSNNQHADLITALEKQLPNNLMLKGYPSWNVPLAKTLNNFPPSIHQNALTNKQACKPEKIDFIKTLPNSDFILTGAKDGSINLWNTRLKLNCNGAHNFKSKLYTDDDFELKHTSSVSKHIGSFVEEEKRSEGEVKLILKKSKIPKPVHYDEITEDILFTMFDEQEEVEESDEGVNSDNGDDYILDYQLDYACLPEQKQVLEMKKETSKEEEKVAVVDKQDKTERKESVTELEQPVEPNQDLLKQLKTMGFQSEIAKKALIITKNESISAAIDKYDEIFKKTIESLIPTTNVPQKKLKIADYECLLCTYINRGGKPNCEMCASAAPETAYIDEKSEEEIQKEKEEALKLQKEEEQKRILEEELKKKKEEEERRKKEEEQLAIQKFEELKQQAKAYYQNVEIVDYLFASFKQGKDSKPFLTAAVMHNSVQKRTDIQFVRLCYSSQYLRNFIGSHNNIQCKVCEIPFSTIDQCLQHVFQFHKTLIENDYPILIGGQLLQQKWNMKLNRHEFHNLRSEECGSITWPFEKLDAVVQIGNDITPEQPMFLIGIGKKEGQDHKTIIIEKIEFSSGSEGGELKIKIVEDDSQIFKQEGISDQVQEAHYCPKSQSLLILTTNHELYKFQVQIIDKKMTIHKKIMMTLQQDEQILRIDQGILQIRSLDRIRRFALDDNSIKKLHDKQIHQKQDKIDSSIPLEEEILKMSIDPMKVTIQDIKRYEKLMNGTPIGAQSNADIVIGNINERYHQGTKYYSKHHWNFDQVIDQSGPIEMEFEHPTSLISLNLELTFNCQDSQKLIEKLQHVEELTVKSDQIVGETQINTSSEQQPILNLGLLSIQGASELIQPSKQADQVVQKPQDYLPLVVHHHKGASYNQSYQVCRLVANNNSIFASNYPKPEFYIQHAHQHVMNIDKITIRSQTNSKCGAYPVGSGIIFISDNLQAFELSSAFHKFTYQEYKEWKQERIKDPTPLQQYEPVAYFEFDQETELTVDVDFKRPCKYIMLKPVGFRKKPVSFTQNINSVPMEIEFFGVSGQSFEDNLLTNNSSAESQAVTINNLWSNHDIQIKVFDENQILKTLNNIEITSLQGFNMNLSPQTIVKNFKDCQKIKLVGKAQLKITDSHMQLQRIKGISLSIQNNKSDIWQLRGVTLEGVSVKIDDHDEKVENKEQKPLFDSHEIPTQYMRSCLLSPKYYSVVNKVLAKVLSSEKHEYQLRLTILKFLNKIMKVDRDFIPLVLQELNLDKFLKFNLFDKDTGGISYIFEFMQNFQRDLKFCYDLYNILLNYVHSLPDTLISYHGYEAFIGMLKWSIPINPEKTLSSLLQTLYQQICLQKVSALQTKECIYFRTRQQFNIFPFDLVVFKPQKIQQGLNKKDQQPQIIQEPRNILPVKQILKHKYEYHHIYDVQFETEMQVTDLKLYLGVLEQAQYKLIIKIFGKDKLIYYGHFEEHIFAQYTQINISQKHSSYEDSLLINNLNFKGTELKVVIEFGISYSSMPKQTNKVKPPDSLIELYGQPTNPSINQKRLKDMLDKKAQEFWTEKAKLFKVGNSVPMLYLTESSQTYKIVPQGTQSAPSQKVEEEKVQSEQQKPQQDQISTIPAPPKYGELQTLQEELKGKIRANDSNIKEIVNKIQNIQANLYSSQVEQTEYNKEIIPSLEYYMNITSDFAKLIMNIIKTQKMGKEKLCQIFRQIEQNGQLSIVCFEFFKRYIAYDQGPVMQDALQFITECLYPVMSLVEKKSFTFKVIEEFLSTAQITFSQKAVLEALTKIGIPEGELISFMIEKLNIKQSPNQSMDLGKLQPFIFMSSVLILAHNSLKQIEIPEPGQVLHKGVCCSCCQAKMIIGWRYKCGHCIGDINLDEKCVEKHLQENPDHILIIIQEPLPYNPKTVKVSKLWQNKSLLPQFKFKEEKPDEAQKNVHDEFACENCGRKPIIGNCYRCVNCEDYNLCQDCYSQNLFDHFSYHVFMRLHKPLQHSEKNPTILLQVLDHRLYAQDHQSQSEKKDKSVSHKQQELAITQDEEEDFEDLVPLSVARSQSVPMPAKQNSSAKQIQQQEHKYERLEFDQQFIILFHTCAWICQDSLKVFTKEEKVVLLKLNIETMLQLIKLTSVKHIYECISNKDTFFHLLVSILQLNSKELITLYKNLLDFVRQPPTLQRKIKEEQKANDKLKQAAKSSDKKQQLNEDQATMRLLLETMISHVQNFLKWLVDIALNPDLAKIQVPQGSEQWANLIFNYQNQRVWLEHLSLILELFIKSTDELKDLTKSQVGPIINGVLEKIPEEANENEQDDELLPISMKRTISVPLAKGQTPKQQQTTSLSLQLIKSLVQLLYLNDQSYQSKQSSQKPSHFKEMEPSTKYLSQMWSLVLKSLTAVSINQLIEARIFDSLVNAFLISTEEIKQITFPQILSISETIAKQSVHANDISKFISNLLFTTLENVTNNHHEKVGYSICQGWLDILISSSVARPPDYESKNQVYAKMSAEEVSTFLKKTSQYLNNFLNKGNFDGPTGANPLMVMRLNLASDLIYVIRYAENKNKPGTLAILELFSSCASNLKLRKEYQESMDNLLAWLFLNSRQPRDDQELSNLGNTSTYTPATTKVKTITDHIESILSILSDSDNNEQAIKIALSSMTSIVKKMNKTILDLSQNNSLGFDMSVKLSEKTNEYFIKLLGQWLISDTVASYFVFDLGGFEFLLDTIGVGEGDQSQNYYSNGLQYEVVSSQEELKETEHQQDQVVQPLSNAFASLAGSDLASYLETNIQEFQQQAQKLIPAAAGQVKEENVQKLQFDKTLLQLQEFSKSLAMVSNNGGDPVAAHQKTDWSVNKRAYKHRIIIKPLVGQLRSEYWILFSLSSPIEVKEIQIGFNNYWGSDTEVYSEPLSVLVEAGMDENNLSLVCNLQIVKDDAFGSVSATVFGANLQTFAIQNTENISSTIEDIIQQKLQSLQNFKIQYVKFCMRRHVLTCLENSPLSTKFTKPPAFGINFISILGFDLSKVGDYLSSIKSDQRRTALEVLSIICSGDFSSILKVIANQQQTIEKMKKSFNQLASLVSVKKNLIEPTFIAISTYNTEMGDWIINEFLKAGKIYKHASLVGEIVMCNKNELPRRLRILQEYVMTQLVQFCEEERSNHGSQIKKLLPFIEIFIQTLRLAAPDIQDVQIDLKITEQQLLKIVSLLSSATQEREQQTKMLIQLLVLLLCPPPPFTNNQVDVYEFAIKYLIDQSSLENQETQHQKEHLASILSVARREIAIELLSKEIKFKKITNPDHDISGDDNANKSQLQHSLKFWIDVAHDMKVKACLNDLKLPMKLYTILKESNPEKNDKIIRNDNMIGEEEILLYIELIKILVAGDKDLEAELSKNLMKDLEYLSKIRDMNFVNKVFLQLLRIESTIPVCLWPYDSDNKKWLSSYKPQMLSDKAQIPSNNNNFVPSQLLQGEKRSVFIKNFKEIVGQHSKGNIKKLLGSNWQLCHSQTEQGQVNQFQGFWKNIENKAPVVIILHVETAAGNPIIFGCYASKGIPAMPANLAQDQDYAVPASPEDFVFCYIDDNNFHHLTPKSGPIIAMYTDYEGGGAISVASDFFLVSFSYDFVFTVGVQYELMKIQEKTNPPPEKEIPESGVTFKKIEVWSFSSGASTSVQNIIQANQKIKFQTISQLDGSLGEIQMKQDFKHPWFNELSPFVNYRTNPVFMVPKHLSVSQLSKILLDSNVSFKPRFNHLLTQNKEIMSEIYEDLNQNIELKQLFNGIIDLEYDVNQLLNIQGQDDHKDKSSLEYEEATTEGSLIQGYVPKMGLFEQFENHGGVKQIISVTLQSLKLWKAEELAKSWELWLKELESFSEIPLFFQLFLKNSRCKDLLFKVLAGLPDTEITAEGGKTDSVAKIRWEEEQKVAVQFNYKILSEAFSISNDLKLRDIAMQCGLLPRILERLGAISGEKPRYIEVEAEKSQIEEEAKEEKPQIQQAEKNFEKKKRKGVGYSSKVGQTFNVAAYLENKKQRNDQIKNLIDICTNFINCKEWKAGEQVLDIILESALLPLLESAFRNGSWLEMAKEYEVYHSYLALARAIAGQKKLLKCLIEVDPKYKPLQHDPIYKLLAKLNELAEIFINCLNQQQKSEQLESKQPIQNLSQEKLLEHQKVMSMLQASYNNMLIKSPESSKNHSNYSHSPQQSPHQSPKKTSPFYQKYTFNKAPSSFHQPPGGQDQPLLLSIPENINFMGSLKDFLMTQTNTNKQEEGIVIEEEIKEEETPQSYLTLPSFTGSIMQSMMKDNLNSEKQLSELKMQMINSFQTAKANFMSKINLQTEKSQDGEEQNEEVEEDAEENWEDESGSEVSEKEDHQEETNKEDESDYVTVTEESVNSKNEEDIQTKNKKKKSHHVKKESKNKSKNPKSKMQKEIDESSSNSSEDKESSDQSEEESEEGDETPNQHSQKNENESYYTEDEKSESNSEGSKSHSSSSESNPDANEESDLYDTESEQTIDQDDNQANYHEMDSEIPETLAREVIKTYKIVQAAIDKVFKNKRDDNFVENALNLPLPLAYKSLLSDMRFDYMDIRDPQNESNYKHHYNSIAQQNQNPPSSKMVRLAQELADLSNALPCEHTNSIYVRVDQQRVDLMKALICGASNTPYAHGCFEYDIFCDNNYPRDPPKMNLITTGNGAVRYNPNLYACGKVCLSLLGTWRGSATENWDPKLSTILQVLLSTQAIIMSEEVYFNEPGFENEAGTPEGEKKNEGYSNIVRYCNIKFAMIEQIKRPPRGFETVIKRHFYIKKPEILKEVNYWIELADKNEATYGGLVNDHNYNWANQFKQTKTKYKEMLQAVVKQLEEELNKLERPTDYELKEQQAQKRKITQKKQKRQAITEGKAELDLDMGTDEDEEQINTESKKEMNVEDEAVKDRWSRYIGAMGVEAVAKQSSANIFVSGAGALGVEISKNIVLSGCKTFTLHDNKPITYRDLSGQFFLNLEEDLLNDKKKKATRGEACLPRLQQLNYYVRCKLADPVAIPLNVSAIEKEPWNFGIYDVIILTEASYEEIQFFDEYCRSKGKKFISADSFGVFTRVFTDFGEKFEVLDKNGEDLQDVMIKNITNEEEGLVELIPNMKHKFEDGDEVLITKVEGMKLLPGEKHNDPAVKSDSINDTIHKVKVISPYTFRIGDTRKFDKYERNGFAKQLKTKVIKNFKSFSETMMKGSAELPLDGNLSIADFEKMSNNQLSHIAFEALDIFKQAYKRMPGVWNKEDAERMIIYAKEVAKRYGMNIEEDFKPESYGTKFLYLFSFTCQGVFNPLCAFMGGFVAQECMKAITAKFTPIHQVFYYDAFEVLPDFDPTKHLNGDSENYFEEKYVKELIKTKETNQRYDGLRIVVGQDLIEKLANTRLFMVGAGAIGCELLKNYAMLGVGVGKPQPKKKLTGGQIVLTDPDVIEVSNLNRQFLFREKHLRKPKSSTAASAAIYMNRDLKENIIARLDKVHEGTSHIFTDQFFEELTVVTNALDNLAARIYIDSRCVTAKTPLLESGTLGPKGHVQVVLPFKTESYGSMNDPEDNTEIPHCTLKMFPEETLHCVEWARDKFSRYFTQGPQSTVKILEEGTNFNPISQQDIMSLKEAIKILKKRPKNFNDCIEYARIKFEKLFNHDIQQLLHVYPIDSKTKDGNYFWSLPKRPPLPINFDQTNPIHCQFIASTACLRANIFKIEIPSKTPRTEEFRKELGKLAAKIDVPEFKPDDEKAKEIQASVNKEVGKEEPKEEESKEEEPKVDPNDLESLMKDFKQLLQDLPVKKGETYIEKLIKPEEFEKDNDANYHIDFIYAMSNCRSNNYKLDFMDWITVKLKAGRIVPALATTTAAIAGLQTLELVKLIKQCKKADHRNVFLNIAVPIMQASEPADVLKTKLTENIEVTLWDRWEVKKGKNIKLHEVIKYIEETYKGLEVRDVMKGNTPIYFNAIMGAPGKEKEKEKILNSKVTDLVGTDSDDKYTDLTLTCVRVGDIEDKIITGVPPVRVYFE